MKSFVGGKQDQRKIAAPVLDGRDKAKIVAATLLSGAVLLAGETIGELAYLPLYAFLAAAFAWQRLRRPRRTGT